MTVAAAARAQWPEQKAKSCGLITTYSTFVLENTEYYMDI